MVAVSCRHSHPTCFLRMVAVRTALDVISPTTTLRVRCVLWTASLPVASRTCIALYRKFSCVFTPHHGWGEFTEKMVMFSKDSGFGVACPPYTGAGRARRTAFDRQAPLAGAR
jgi:hypothetical protein